MRILRLNLLLFAVSCFAKKLTVDFSNSDSDESEESSSGTQTHCRMLSTCWECSTKTDCGWCVKTEQCLFISDAESSLCGDIVSRTNDLSCCHTYLSCSECVTDANCGWCSSENRACYDGNKLQPDSCKGVWCYHKCQTNSTPLFFVALFSAIGGTVLASIIFISTVLVLEFKGKSRLKERQEALVAYQNRIGNELCRGCYKNPATYQCNECGDVKNPIMFYCTDCCFALHSILEKKKDKREKFKLYTKLFGKEKTHHFFKIDKAPSSYDGYVGFASLNSSGNSPYQFGQFIEKDSNTVSRGDTDKVLDVEIQNEYL